MINLENKEEFNDWYINCRPKTFDEVLFQPSIIKYLKECQKTDTWPKGTYFSAGYGQGKTTLAKIIALNMACKNKNDKHEPCLECPTCKSIINENWDRDVLLVNAAVDGGKDDVVDVLDNFLRAPSIRDAAKVLIIDEIQSMSVAGLSALLKVLESPRKKQYLILTDMGGRGGSATNYALKALKSRCKSWSFNTPKGPEIYDGLVSFIKTHKDLIDLKSAPITFWQEGLRLISEAAQGSFRQAIQLFEQCYKGGIFDLDDIKQTYDIVTYDDMINFLTAICNGGIEDPVVFDTITGHEYQEKFNLAYKIISDAEVFRAFGKFIIEKKKELKGSYQDIIMSDDGKTLDVVERTGKHVKYDRTESDWGNASTISKGKYFEFVKDEFKRLSRIGGNYIMKGEWQVSMAELVNKIKDLESKKECKNAFSGETTPPVVVRRSPVAPK